MTNRIELMHEAVKGHIAKALQEGRITETKIEELRKGLDMETDEYCKFQELKSLAQVSGALSLDEANSVYRYLGNTVDHFNKQSYAVKVTLTRLFAELLQHC